jgi:spore maturation protein CgeB
VVIGLTITSSWGNGHATTYRSLLGGLRALGHRVLFLEREQPWYADNRDLKDPSCARVEFYSSVSELKRGYLDQVRRADLVIVGSYVADGVEIGDWVTRQARGLSAFYDIDTPITLAQLRAGQAQYISRELVPRYGLYLSFAGGPALELLERKLGSPCARALYCAVDPEIYYPQPERARWDLAYLGTYSDDRQPSLDRLLLAAARAQPERKFAVVGPQYPESVVWPANVERETHLPPSEHRAFYNRQRFTLNITREAMRASGYAPSVRLFEAAACGTPIISDDWPGIESVLDPGREILIARSTDDVRKYLLELSDDERVAIGERARQRVLAQHTGLRRAQELTGHIREAQGAADVTTAGMT